jgi:hypothetical protein
MGHILACTGHLNLDARTSDCGPIWRGQKIHQR